MIRLVVRRKDGATLPRLRTGAGRICMESSFTHPSTYELFCYQFAVGAVRDRERVEEHLWACGPCREAFEGVERNHPAPESLRLYALDRLHFAQGNVVRLHVTKCPYCRQVVDHHRSLPEQAGEAGQWSEEPPEMPRDGAVRATRVEITSSESAGASGGERGKNLQSIDVAGFFELGGALADCLAKVRRPIESYHDSLGTLKTLLADLFAGDMRLRMDRAAPAALRLLGLIEGIHGRHRTDPSAILDDVELREFTEACAALERGISRDLGSAATY